MDRSSCSLVHAGIEEQIGTPVWHPIVGARQAEAKHLLHPVDGHVGCRHLENVSVIHIDPLVVLLPKRYGVVSARRCSSMVVNHFTLVRSATIVTRKQSSQMCAYLSTAYTEQGPPPFGSAPEWR